MVDALTWLLAVEILGILVLPLCFILFRRLPDRGITLAKPLALVLFSYVLWMAGLTHIAPNTRLTVVLILVLGAVGSGMLLRTWGSRILEFLREEWRTLLIAEVVFLGLFFLWLGIVSETPAISGTEKPMDFGFMNAVLQSRFFPPEDPWLAGNSISYYYFGHFIMAFLAKVTAIESSVGYNLSISLVPALVGIGAFGLMYNLVRLSGAVRRTAIIFGLVAPALILLLGNLEGALEFVHAQGWGGSSFWEWVGIKGLDGGAASSGAFPDNYNWWWNASRVIDTLADGQSLDYTITEFPVFSFLLGDLHPHVVALPFVILSLSLVLNLFRSEDRMGFGWLFKHPFEAFAVALFVGSLAFINIWDLPVMAGILIVSVLVKSYAEGQGDLQRAVFNGVIVIVPILVVAVVLFLPFYATFSGQAMGILPLEDNSTRPFLFFVTMGLFSVLALSFVLRQLPGLRRPAREEAPFAGLVLTITLAPWLIWVMVVFFLTIATDGASSAIDEVVWRSLWVLPGLAIVSVAAFSAAHRLRNGSEPATAFPLLLVAVAFYLLVGAELFYVNDSFSGAFRRMNTVFKVYYQSWLLLGLVGAYAMYYWRSHATHAEPDTQPVEARGILRKRAVRFGNIAWGGAIAILVVSSAYYPVGAVLSRTGVLDQNHSLSDNTLNGLAFVRDQDPGEYAAIRWLRDEAPWGRIVEAVGNDYSDYGRISSSTGLPTVLGWKGHELQWRGTSRAFAGREEAVIRIYQSDDGEEVKRLLEVFEISYVYVGKREQTDYGAGNLASFGGFLRTAFEQNGVVIYELINRATGDPGGDDGQGSG